MRYPKIKEKLNYSYIIVQRNNIVEGSKEANKQPIESVLEDINTIEPKDRLNYFILSFVNETLFRCESLDMFLKKNKKPTNQ